MWLQRWGAHGLEVGTGDAWLLAPMVTAGTWLEQKFNYLIIFCVH